MSDLDEKLRGIVWSIVNPLYTSRKEIKSDQDAYVERKAAQIKKAFDDAGYVKTPSAKTVAQIVNENLEDIKKAHNLQSGQEWYDRFIREYKTTNSYSEEYAHGKDAIGAARKAANLDES